MTTLLARLDLADRTSAQNGMKCSKCCHQDRQLQGNPHRGGAELALLPGIIPLCRNAGKWRGECGLRASCRIQAPQPGRETPSMNSARGKVRTRVSPDGSPDAATRDAAVHGAIVCRDIEHGTVAGEARHATPVDDVPWRRAIAGTEPGRARGGTAWRTC
jgi:hypothetical protein